MSGRPGPPTRWKLVVLESPYAAATQEEFDKNKAFARACLRDCLSRNESPIASHLLLTQQGVLDDNDPDQRKVGIGAGHAWTAVADAVVVYTDLGISAGMRAGITVAEAHRKEIIYRVLNGDHRRSVRDKKTPASD